MVQYIKDLHEQLKTKEDYIETIKEELRCSNSTRIREKSLVKVCKTFLKPKLMHEISNNTITHLLVDRVHLEIGSYCSLQLSGRQKLLFDWNFKRRAFLVPPGPPLFADNSIPLKSL